MEGHEGGPLLGVAWLKLGSQVDVTSPLPPGGGWFVIRGRIWGDCGELVPSTLYLSLRGTPTFCHCEALRAEAISRLNPKLEALNPKQIPISKFKTFIL